MWCVSRFHQLPGKHDFFSVWHTSVGRWGYAYTTEACACSLAFWLNRE